MNIETVGHAGLLVRDDQGTPVLFTDPWISGSCYWRSWWLQNYPAPELVAELQRVRYCVITHEHPDHFHTASIRVLGPGVHYLGPDLPHGRIVPYLSGLGLRTSTFPAFEWRAIHDDIQILSIPLFNDDSVLLINPPSAVIVNLNDAKPRRGQLQQLAAGLDAAAPGKTRILLSSYSPASIVNSFLRHDERVSLREKSSYVRYIAENCRLMKIDYFLPFASQVIFRRSDSAWANDFKVTFEDLHEHWDADSPTRLLRPYTRLDLRTGATSFVPPEQYRQEEDTIVPKVQAQEALDTQVSFDDGDLQRLAAKLNASRWLLAMMFPRGIGFELEHTRLRYSPWSGVLQRGSSSGDFVLRVPAQAFKDAVQYGHFGDLGTTMFTMVVLNSTMHPRRVYLFFMLVTLHDYGHTTSLRNWLTWVRHSIGIHGWRIPRNLSQAEPVSR